MKSLIAAAVLVSLGPGTARAAEPIPRPVVPAAIEVGAEFKLINRGHAIGTQNFICAPAATPSGVDWLFIGPQATLFGADGKQITTHFQSMNPLRNNAIQATWHHSTDTSVVWATRLNGSSDPLYVAPGAIEWLVLEATAQPGPTGGLKLAKVTRIQRVHTVGGVKPAADGCTPATLNTRKLVPYEADYYFYE